MWYRRGYGDEQGWYSPGGAGSTPNLIFIGGGGTGSPSGAVETFASVNIGSAAGFTTRRVIIVMTTNTLAGGTSISSVQANGSISGTVHVQQLNGGSGPFAAIFSFNIPTGSTASIAVTFSASVFNGHQLSVYTVDDATLLSTTPSVGNGIATSATSAATSSFTQTAGGFTLAGEGLSSNGTSIVITGYTTNQFGGTSNQIASSLTSIASTGSTTAASTWGTAVNAAIVAASWR